ncbi:hypothetical protein [Pelagicoccus mobilis]|uniref:Uncharacterized protein n=1 Tax=Pelagicoccus mobilis TaxID=415221 RepID=A0A934RVP1_9BACT|nr:hypothetical protein [Pelagicoccus mobilis]MBK1877331.1 hypothetical protein [Pelagicoccus mobilis]
MAKMIADLPHHEETATANQDLPAQNARATTTGHRASPIFATQDSLPQLLR